MPPQVTPTFAAVPRPLNHAEAAPMIIVVNYNIFNSCKKNKNLKNNNFKRFFWGVYPS
jgi:hypothetical protein